MKIIHLIYDDLKNPWCGGGGALRTLEIYKRIVKGNDIVVISGSFPKCKRYEEIQGIKYFRVGFSLNYFISRVTYSIGAMWCILMTPHDILIEDFSAHSPVFSFLFSRKPIIGIFQNLFGKHELKRFKGIKKIRGVLSLWFETIAIKSFKHTISVSEFLKKDMLSYNEKYEVTVIYNGIEDMLFAAKSQEKNYILYLGRFDIEQKGIDMLLNAYKILHTHWQSASEKDLPDLLIVGRGKDENPIKEMIDSLNLSDKVKVIPPVSGEAKRKMLEECLFICMPSRFESFGIVAGEASACGKAVIGTKIEGFATTIIDRETGILVENENPLALAEAIKTLVNDDDLRKSLGQKGRAWSKQFNWDIVAQEQFEYYKKIIRTR